MISPHLLTLSKAQSTCTLAAHSTSRAVQSTDLGGKSCAVLGVHISIICSIKHNTYPSYITKQYIQWAPLAGAIGTIQKKLASQTRTMVHVHKVSGCGPLLAKPPLTGCCSEHSKSLSLGATGVRWLGPSDLRRAEIHHAAACRLCCRVAQASRKRQNTVVGGPRHVSLHADALGGNPAFLGPDIPIKYGCRYCQRAHGIGHVHDAGQSAFAWAA